MADKWVLTIPWLGGEGHQIGLDIGPDILDKVGKRLGSEVSSLAGVLRMGFHHPDVDACLPTVRFRARIRLPDNGNQIYPIDLPSVATVELPCRVEIKPDTTLPESEPVTVELAAVDDTSWYGRFQMGTTVELPEAVQVPLPPWVTSVSLIDNAVTATWHDVTGAVIGTFAGADNPRSRLAHFIQSGGEYNTLALLHFQA